MGDLKTIDRVQFYKNSLEFYSNMHSFDIQRESSVDFTTFIYLLSKKRGFPDIRKIYAKKEL